MVITITYIIVIKCHILVPRIYTFPPRGRGPPSTTFVVSPNTVRAARLLLASLVVVTRKVTPPRLLYAAQVRRSHPLRKKMRSDATRRWRSSPHESRGPRLQIRWIGMREGTKPLHLYYYLCSNWYIRLLSVGPLTVPKDRWAVAHHPVRPRRGASRAAFSLGEKVCMSS